MQFNIEHRTSYQYSDSVNYTIQQLRLTPQDGFGQRVIKWDIRVNGQLQRFNDAFGNITHTLVLDKPHDKIEILAYGDVETEQPVISNENGLPLQVYLRETDLTKLSPELKAFAFGYQAKKSQSNTNWIEELMDGILSRVPRVKGTTDASTTAAKAFEGKAGVCQDHAHIFIACCRALGLPARYVSGYLFTPDGSLMESHGWVDVWLEKIGWQSFDVSNQCRTNGVHIRLAIGLDYHDACPVSGMRIGGGKESMLARVHVNQSGQIQQ